jgi:hypothetical protein
MMNLSSRKCLDSGIFRGIIDFVSSIDDAVKEHIQNSAIFKGISRTIQNELSAYMLEMCQEIIKKISD